jgi:hypothetical protein
MIEPKSEHQIRREHYVTGRQDERERIIELLSDYLLDKLPNDDGEVEPSQPNEWDGLEKAIALIKGESE